MSLFLPFELNFFFFDLFLSLVFLLFFLFFFQKYYTSNFQRIILSSLFFFLLVNNFMGIVSGGFSTTSSLFVPMVFSLYYFFGFSQSYKIYNIKPFIYHFCPENIPMILTPMLILIETLSFFVRPIALFLRLFANITAGHILLGLISSFLPLIFFFLLMPLILLELAVCFIQRYVFSLLLILWYVD